MNDLTAVILAGSQDFGRCPLASRLPLALWPVIDKPAIERLVFSLKQQGVSRIFVAINESTMSVERHLMNTPFGRDIYFFREKLPVGTAGCLREAAKIFPGNRMIVINANIINPPEISILIDKHLSEQAELSIFFNSVSESSKGIGTCADVFICENRAVSHIIPQGYCDIKETLIPEILKAGRKASVLVSDDAILNYRKWDQYLRGLTQVLESDTFEFMNFKVSKMNQNGDIFTQGDAHIHQNAKIKGKNIILDGAEISEDVVLIGPNVVGQNVKIDEGACLSNSVIWNKAVIQKDALVDNCVVDENAVIKSNSEIKYRSFSKVERKSSVHEKNGKLSVFPEVRKNIPHKQFDFKYLFSRYKVLAMIILCFILAAFLWSYWPVWKEIWSIWCRSDEYSSGMLVPPMAVYILWVRRKEVFDSRIKPFLLGIFVIFFAEFIRFFGVFYMFGSAERLSVVISIMGVVLFIFGWEFFKKVLPILLFLFLMLPWPNRVQTAITIPLQSWSTASAVFCLEMMGFEVVREGNVIHLGQTSVAVAEACNGLRMITAFFVISGLVILIVKRKLWEKVVVFVSSLPIALICNTIRLTLTALAFTVIEGERWEIIFHDFGGYAMMPLALAMIVGELWILDRLTIEQTVVQPIVISRKNS